MSEKDFNTDHLNKKQKQVAEVNLKVARAVYGPDASGGGCHAFYTPEEWKERGETYGLNSILIVVHDGGNLAPLLNLDYMEYDLHNRMTSAFDDTDFYVEQCTGWSSAIYPSR